MQYRQLGKTDLNLTTIGLGTWAMGGPWQFGWGEQDDDEAVGSILQAFDCGINWIDTAPIYGLGHSEELVGKALKQTNFKPFIATKCGLLWDDKKRKVECLKKNSIRNECHQSLKRIGAEVIDLYQMHWPIPDEDIEQAWQEMTKLQQEGKVRYIGVSNFNLEQIERAHKINSVASFQPPYSMLHRQIENGPLNFCADNDIGIIVYSPMQRGLLTGKFSFERLAKLPDNDHRKTHSDFQQPQFGATLELVEKLKPIAEQNDITLAQLAISWVLRRSEIAAAIVGARRPSQIKETAAASDFNLSDEDTEKIENLLRQRQNQIETAG